MFFSFKKGFPHLVVAKIKRHRTAMPCTYIQLSVDKLNIPKNDDSFELALPTCDSSYRVLSRTEIFFINC